MRALPKTQWGTFFDQVSKDLAGGRAIVEIQSLEFVGDHRQARSLPLIGITYDPKGDVLEIAMEGLDHLIHAPQKISVKDGLKGLEAVEIVAADEQKQIVKLVKPLRYRQRD